MQLETRFGISDTDESKIIKFPAGLPGFEELHKFIIIEVGNMKPIFWLQSIEEKEIALPVIISFAILNDYNINIRENELEELGIDCKEDLLILNVVVIPEDIKKMTVNLAAPVVINTKSGIGKQIVIDASELPIRYPVYEAILKSKKGGDQDAGINTQGG